MRSRLRSVPLALLSVVLAGGPAVAVALPEIPFCPLGGPPGWLNRLTDDDDHHYPPPYYPPPPVAPYWSPVYPAPYVLPYPIYPLNPYR